MLGLQVKVSGIPKTAEELAQCFVNVYQNILPISPTTLLSDHDIGLTHFSKESLRNANEVISVRYHRTQGIPIDIVGSVGVKSNRLADPKKWIIGLTNSFDYPTDNILLTGIYNDLGQPLFWRHNFPASSVQFGVTITDQDGNLVPSNTYKVITEADPLDITHAALQGVVAHYLLSNPSKNKYYLINYRNADGSIVQEVLDQRPLFTKSPSIAHLFTFSQNPDAKLLTFHKSQDSAVFSFQLPDDYGVAAFREYQTSYMRAHLPPSLGPNEAWFPVVPNFNWIRFDTSLYTFPEWAAQNFCSTAPHVCTSDDVGTVLGKHLVQVSNIGLEKTHESIGTDHFIKLLLYQENDDNTSKAITNDSSLDGVQIASGSEVLWEYSPLSVIADEGIIYSPIDLSSYSWCFADYPYESFEMPIYLRDLNPFRDNSLRTQTVVYYIVPNFEGQERSIEYITYDEDLVVTSTSQDGVNSNNPAINDFVGTMIYSLPEGEGSSLSAASTLGLQVMVANSGAPETFISRFVEGQKYVVLGEFSFPETLDESANALLTDVREQKQLDAIEVRKANPDMLTSLSDSVLSELVSIPALIRTQEYRCHWGLFNDYNPNSLYSLETFEGRLRKMVPGATTNIVTFEGLAQLNVKSIDIVNNQITLQWHAVPGIDKDTVVSGVLYKGTEEDDVSTQVASITNLAKTTEYTVSFGVDELLFFKLESRAVVDTQTIIGPSSNVVYFSFKR